MAFTYFRADERPYWEATIVVNGVAEDLSTGHTFEVNIAASTSSTPVTTKTTNITGSSGGVVTVAWTNDDLDIPEGIYLMQLTVTRTSDSAQWTVSESIQIIERLGA